MSAIRLAAILLAVCFAGAAEAKDDFPNMIGTWKGPAHGVFVAAPGPSREPRFASMELTLDITKQEDRRFAGTIKTPNSTKPLVGVIDFNGNVLWSEPGGFVEGRFKDADTIQGCYVRVSGYSHIAACEEFKRQK